MERTLTDHVALCMVMANGWRKDDWERAPLGSGVNTHEREFWLKMARSAINGIASFDDTQH